VHVQYITEFLECEVFQRKVEKIKTLFMLSKFFQKIVPFI